MHMPREPRERYVVRTEVVICSVIETDSQNQTLQKETNHRFGPRLTERDCCFAGAKFLQNKQLCAIWGSRGR
jgi:hypothetical protein